MEEHGESEQRNASAQRPVAGPRVRLSLADH
jgi:hypothetical protein